jgi:PhzF family phenazine biosynthesis protein
VRTQDGDVIVFVRDVLALNGLRPAFGDLAGWSTEHGVRGLCVSTISTLAPSISCQSRVFAPAAGINEDPVTGSVHGPLAAHLVACGVVRTFNNLAALTCVQSAPAGRAGLIRVLVQHQTDNRYDVRIGGQCVAVARGVLSPEVNMLGTSR